MTDEQLDSARPFLMGNVSAVVNERKSAKVIIDEMVQEAVDNMSKGNAMIQSKSKL